MQHKRACDGVGKRSEHQKCSIALSFNNPLALTPFISLLDNFLTANSEQISA